MPSLVNTIIHGLLTAVPLKKNNKRAIFKKSSFSCATTC